MKLDELLGLPRSGVVIVGRGSSFLVSYTTSMGAELCDLYNQFGGQSGLTLRVCSANCDLETLRLHTEYYRNMYGSVGHKRTALRYKVRIVPGVGLKYVDVELVSARGEGKVVARFKNAREAREFIETYYGEDNPFRLPVYAANSATKEFLQEKQTKLLDIK